jgi:hypothetical protein
MPVVSSPPAVNAFALPCSKVMKDADAEFERCNGTPAFLAPEMMRPHARYRWVCDTWYRYLLLRTCPRTCVS